MGLVRTGKFGSAVLVGTCVLLAGCSALTQRLRNLDVTGYGAIKWGMTLAQVQKLLGPKARIETDPKSGMRLEYVRMTIGGIEREGFLGTDAGTDHVSSVHFIITDPSTKDTFNVLKRNLVATYGVSSSEQMMPAGRLCFWQFASSNITLHLFGADDDFKGGVLLTFIKNPLGLPILQSESIVRGFHRTIVVTVTPVCPATVNITGTESPIETPSGTTAFT